MGIASLFLLQALGLHAFFHAFFQAAGEEQSLPNFGPGTAEPRVEGSLELRGPLP